MTLGILYVGGSVAIEYLLNDITTEPETVNAQDVLDSLHDHDIPAINDEEEDVPVSDTNDSTSHDSTTNDN